MARTKINVSTVLQSASKINTAKNRVSNTVYGISATKNGIDWKIRSRNNIGNRLNAVQNLVNQIDDEISSIGVTINRGAMEYVIAENIVMGYAREVSGVYHIKRPGELIFGRNLIELTRAEDFGSFNVNRKNPSMYAESVLEQTDYRFSIEELAKKIKLAKPYAIASIINSVSPVAGLLYLTSGVAYGKIPSITDASRNSEPSVGGDWLGYEISDDNHSITGWLGKAYAEAESEWGYAGINAYLGKAESEADVGFSFMEKTKKKEKEDGKWVEKTEMEFVKAEIGASVSVSAITVDGEAGIGTDMLGLEGEATGGVGNAKAEAKGEFSITEDGVNAYAKGEAMVSAAEGEIEGTINILGIEITGSIGGYAGALGVEGKVGIEDNKWVLKGGVAAVLGISGGVEIGFNDEGWDNFTEGASDFVDFLTFWD